MFFYNCQKIKGFSFLEKKNKALDFLKQGFSRVFGFLGYSEGWETHQK